MNLQRDNIITKRALEWHMEEEDNQWILGSLTTISKMGSLSASIVTSTDIWQRNVEQRRRNEKHEHVLNATRRGTLPKTVKRNR